MLFFQIYFKPYLWKNKHICQFTDSSSNQLFLYQAVILFAAKFRINSWSSVGVKVQKSQCLKMIGKHHWRCGDAELIAGAWWELCSCVDSARWSSVIADVTYKAVLLYLSEYAWQAAVTSSGDQSVQYFYFFLFLPPQSPITTSHLLPPLFPLYGMCATMAAGTFL